MSANNYANKEQLIDLLQAQQVPILGAGGGFAPIGKLGFYDGTVAPQGWLACDGTVYNISDYPELATHYASHHGASNFYGGNGTTTFAVPDLRAEFLRGWGNNSHANQGNGGAVGEHQDGTVFNKSIQESARLQDLANMDAYTTKATGLNGVANTVTQTSEVFTSRPTNTSFMIIVKATVAGDPNAHQYSTEEHVSGKWVDGSDVYEKTVTANSLASGGTIGNIGTGCKMISAEGSGSLSSGNRMPFTYSNVGNESISFYVTSTGAIQLATSFGTVYDIIITIQYTKAHS